MGCSESRHLRAELKRMLATHDKIEENVDILLEDLEICSETNRNLRLVLDSVKEHFEKGMNS